jgi:hypothetical protein
MAEAELAQSGMVRFVLVGQRGEWSGYVGGAAASRHKFAFSNGVCTLPFQIAEQSRKRLAFFSAYPEGSQELADAREAWERQQGDEHGSTETPSAGSGFRPAGAEPTERPAALGAGNDEAAPGETGVVSNGDGQERASEPVDSPPPARATSIEDAVQVLDHSKDDQWTQDGKPSIKLIQQLCKDPTIKRAEIDAVGVTRQT